MNYEINTPAEVAQEATCRPFEVRFTGTLSEVESELALAVRSGRASWCGIFRDIHDADLIERAPFEMLKDFANAAPSPLLQGYVLGVLYARENPEWPDISRGEWAARANTVDDPAVRGAVLGCASAAFRAATKKPEPVSRSANVRVNSKRRRSPRNPS